MAIVTPRHHPHHLHRRRPDEARRSFCFPTKRTHFVFLISIIIYLSIYHLRSQNVHLLLADRTNLMAVQSDAPRTFFSMPGGVPAVPLPTAVIPRDVNLGSYSPHHDPKLLSEPSATSKPVQVHFLTGSTSSISTQARFLIEGIERSQYLKLVHISFLEQDGAVKVLEVNDVDTKVPILWMVDILSLGHDCHDIEALIRHAKDFDKKQKKRSSRLLLIDYSGSSEVVPCSRQMDDLVGKKYWRMAQRGITHGRHWNPERNWVEVGAVRPNSGSGLSGGTVLHSPFPVREIIVMEVDKFVEKQKVLRGRDKLRPVDATRGTDVTLFWRKGDSSHYGNLRREVASVITSLQSAEVGDRKLRTLVRFFGELDTLEQNVVYAKYVEEMMGTKVIVVAQRDEWEDHYRLMESLATGALVFTDVVVGMPEGLIHQKNIVIYDSAESLRQLLLYYLHPQNDRERLSIAKKGWELVMGHHRCWHRVEELAFGTALTAVDKVYDATTPPRRERSKTSKPITRDPVQLAEVSIAEAESPVSTEPSEE